MKLYKTLFKKRDNTNYNKAVTSLNKIKNLLDNHLKAVREYTF